MNQARYPLLLTGTIDSGVYHNVGNRIQDVEERRRQYEESIGKYICDTPFDPIVFIENSGYAFSAGKFQQLAAEHGKQFEFIPGSIQVEEVLKRGKSFGDAFLIHEGLLKSKLLAECSYFYKITGRIFLKNAKKIVKTCEKYKNEFIIYNSLGWCLTNIFKANKEDYLRVLDDIYLDCDETAISDIEIAFYRRLSSSDLELGSFETYPYFSGIQGATLTAYSGSFAERTLRNVLARIHFFTPKSRFARIEELYAKLRKKRSYK